MMLQLLFSKKRLSKRKSQFKKKKILKNMFIVYVTILKNLRFFKIKSIFIALIKSVN